MVKARKTLIFSDDESEDEAKGARDMKASHTAVNGSAARDKVPPPSSNGAAPCEAVPSERITWTKQDNGQQMGTTSSLLVFVAVLTTILLCIYYSHPPDSGFTLLAKGHLITEIFMLIIGFCWEILFSVLMALLCCAFTLLVTYFDSLKPGLHPPTPLSPRKIREESGHTFHLSYIMPVINGVAVFICTFWWLDGNTTVV